jgi:uncharacterized protein YjbJ (UPF0337 family)
LAGNRSSEGAGRTDQLKGTAKEKRGLLKKLFR